MPKICQRVFVDGPPSPCSLKHFKAKNCTKPRPAKDMASENGSPRVAIWVCLKIVYPYTQRLMIIIPTKWL